jgi:N4-(beta-N-acetylglucosaminyl)-L-asparaginase
MMKQGKSPQEACEIAAKRVIKLNLLSNKNRDHIYQVGFIAVNIKGECGAASVREGFEYAIFRDNENKLIESKYIIDEKFSVEDI